MKVALMVEALTPQLSGIGRYTWELCQHLEDHAEVEELRFRRNGQWVYDPAELLIGEPSGWQWTGGVPLYGTRRIVKKWHRWRERKVPATLLFHGPNYFLPREVKSGVITVHDLSVFRHPEAHPAARIAHFERDFASSIRRARHVITDTETVRKEVIAHTGLDPDRVTAVPLGVDPVFRPRDADEAQEALARHGLRWGGYGLCVSALEPRKRIGDLLRAWAALPRNVRDAHPLVLLGPKGWLNEDLHRLIVQGREEGWLLSPGYVAEADLPHIYAGARLFAYPSIYEGFGLPPLEAMASGVPVIISNRSCLPEVCGDAAAQIDPDDTHGFVAAIERGLTDAAWSEQARTAGLARAAGFTWARCVEETLAVYRSVERS